MTRSLRILLALPLLLAPLACRRQGTGEVVIYTSVDQPHAEPVLKRFEERTGLRVRAVYDVEAVKTVGLANRIREERERPRADVFWNGEILQTLRLEQEGLLAPYRPPTAEGLSPSRRQETWTAIGGRARVFLVDARRMQPERHPKSLEDLAASPVPPAQRGLAQPLFGTTLTHAAALYVTWGPERTRAYFEALKTQGVRFLGGNASVRDAVVRGELIFGLTDTDDAEGALRRGAPVAVAQLQGEGALWIPSTVALVKGGPNPAAARRLADFLASPEAEELLSGNGFWQVTPRRPGASRSLPAATPVPPDVDWRKVLAELPRASRDLQAIFVR